MRVIINTAVGSYDTAAPPSGRDYSKLAEQALRWLRPEFVVSEVPVIGSLPPIQPFGPPPEHNLAVITAFLVAGGLVLVGIVLGFIIAR